MTLHKVAIPILGEEIVPRFDLTTEVVILTTTKSWEIQDRKIIVLPRSSSDELCHTLLAQEINTLICGAIEDEYYEFLKWKKIAVFDGVSGTWTQAFNRWQNQTLNPGDILFTRMVEGNLI
jgi:predicted Fe-Mo cluster-binding NifX family protein